MVRENIHKHRHTSEDPDVSIKRVKRGKSTEVVKNISSANIWVFISFLTVYWPAITGAKQGELNLLYWRCKEGTFKWRTLVPAVTVSLQPISVLIIEATTTNQRLIQSKPATSDLLWEIRKEGKQLWLTADQGCHFWTLRRSNVLQDSHSATVFY